jgi:hypothetical protein
MDIHSYDDFKAAVTTAVVSQGRTRSQVARDLEQQGRLRAHTVMCLLSTAPVIGKRTASFDSAVTLADAAGLRITLTPKEIPCPASHHRKDV